MNTPLLDIADLNLRFDSFRGTSHVLRDVCLSVQAGERVGLVGESGCGKSVLLRSILGLLARGKRKLEGSIVFENEELVDLPEGRMRQIRGGRISMIFQDPSASLNPVFTIGDQLADIALRHGAAEDNKSARELLCVALRAVSIDDPERVLDSYPFQLSGGMNQRVMITAALINKPRLILADEPGTALDVSIQEQTLHLMHRLTEASGTAVLMITHNLGVVRQFAERVCVMYAGMIVEEATVADLFEAPSHPYTQALLAAVPRLVGGAMPEAIEGTVPDFVSPPPGCRFAPRCPRAFARCHAQVPDMRDIGGGHRVACHLFGQEQPS